MGGAALALLTNPNVLDWVGRQVSGGTGQTGTNALAALSRPLDGSVGYEFLAGTPATGAAEFIAPWSGPITNMGSNGVPVTWNAVNSGAGAAMDGGLEGAAGAGAAAEGGNLLSSLFSLYGTMTGSAMGDALGSLGGAILGNYIVGQAPIEGRRDPTGKHIGAAIGSLVGTPIPFIGPMLGAIIGGGIGSQFGPMASVGSNWGGMNTWSPDSGWSYHSGADNGGRVNDPAAQQFQEMLQSLATQRGYEINPMSQGAAYTVGQYSGNGPNAPGQGWYYQPGAGQFEGIQRFFGNDLTAQSGGGFGMRPDGSVGTYGDAMLGYALSDLIGQGLYVPTGTALQGADLTNALATRAADQYAAGAPVRDAQNAVGTGN